MVTFNYWAITTCTIMNMILGALWYSPLLFGITWAKLMGFDFNKMKNDPIIRKNAQKGYIISSVCHCIMATMMAHFIESTHASGSWFDGLKTGLYCWLGFTLPTMLSNHVFSTTSFSWLLVAINVGYPMIGLSTSGAILAVWR